MLITRRTFTGALAAASVAPLRAAATPFRHSVASGDPLARQVILWTRISGVTDPAPVVQWKIALDPAMQQVVQTGQTATSPDRDYTVKVDVSGLSPATTYYYQFSFNGGPSPVGRTKTLPVGSLARLRLAVASCSNYPYGFFNAYGLIARRADLDAWLHLGDFTYEYANGTFGDGTSIGRIPLPDKETVTLSDYRTRYAQYRTDVNLQEVSRQLPLIAVWDDHESANNAWKDGAQNHNPDQGEGDWATRKAAAQQAWREWLPVRETTAASSGQIYRTLPFGDLADLIMLDTRLYGRDEQVAATDPEVSDPARTLLGTDQEAWFYNELSQSKARGARWRLIGQQVMMGQLRLPSGTILNPDQWDGYLPSRNRVLDHISQNSISNMVVLTGDIHSSWGSDITYDPFDREQYSPLTGRGSLAVEFVTPGITSPAATDQEQADALEAIVHATQPHIKYVDLYHQGYMVLDVDRSRVQAEWYYPTTVLEPVLSEQFGFALKTVTGTNRVSKSDGPATPPASALLAP